MYDAEDRLGTHAPIAMMLWDPTCVLNASLNASYVRVHVRSTYDAEDRLGRHAPIAITAFIHLR